jgi:hypothetical protein
LKYHSGISAAKEISSIEKRKKDSAFNLENFFPRKAATLNEISLW